MNGNQAYNHDLFEAVLLLGKMLGFSRSIAIAFATLYSHDNPLSIEDIAAASGLSKSAVSLALRDLAQMDAVHEVMNPGQRRRHYCGQPDLAKVSMDLVVSRMKFPLARLRDKLNDSPGTRFDQVRNLLDTLEHTLEAIQIEKP